MPEEHKTDPERSEAAKKEDLKDIPLHSLKMTQLIELDSCTRCGECLSWCPVYDQDAKEAIIPRRKVIDFLKIAKAQQGYLTKIMRNEKISEPLKAILGRIFRYHKITKAEIDDFVQNLYECSTCGQCEVVCPAHIETVMLWEELRRVIVQAGYGPLEAQKALVKSVKAFDNPWQQPRAARTKWARRAKKDGLIQNLPREIRKTKAKVLLFFGCTAAYDVNVKQVAINTINILEALNIDYGILGSEEKCCASVLLRMGDPEHKRVFKENIDLFNSLGIETLISSCSGCFKTIMQDYPRVAPLNFEVLHTVEFLTRLLKQGQLRFPHPVNRTVTYHDPCHLGRATGGFDAPRMIMERHSRSQARGNAQEPGILALLRRRRRLEGWLPGYSKQNGPAARPGGRGNWGRISRLLLSFLLPRAERGRHRRRIAADNEGHEQPGGGIALGIRCLPESG